MANVWLRALALIALGTAVVGCASEPGASPPDGGGTAARAAWPAGTRALPQLGQAQVIGQRRAAPGGIAAAIERTRYAFLGGPEGHGAAFGSWSARAHGGGVTVTPRRLTTPPEPALTALELQTASWARGTNGWKASDATTWRSEAEGGVQADRGAAVEHVRGAQAGVEVSWSWASAPQGEGDLVVRVGVKGQRYDGTTSGGLHFVDDASGQRLRFGRGTWIDADGHEVDVLPTWERGEIVLRVPADVVAASTFPAVLDPTVGAESAVDAPIVASPVTEEVAVADDGTNFLVVWSADRDGTGNNVYGVRVAPTGAVLDSIGFYIGLGGQPDVTFDGTNFIVSRTTPSGVSTTGVTTAGTLTSGGLSLAGCLKSHLASQTSLGLTLLVAGCTGTARGVLSGGGASFQIAGVDNVDPDVAYSNNYFVVVTREVSSKTVFATTVTGDQFLTQYTIATTATTPQRPAVACTGATCLVTWDTTLGLYSSIFSGTSATSAVAIDAGGRAALAYDGTNFLVAYVGAAQDPRACNVSKTGVRGTCLTLPGGPAVDSNTSPAVSYEDNRTLMVWVDGASTQAVKGMRLTKTPTAEDAAPLTLSSGNNFEYDVALASNGSGYFAAWTDDRDEGPSGWEVYGTRLSATGSPADVPALHVSTPGSFADENAIAGYVGGNYLVAYESSASGVVTRLVPPSGALGATHSNSSGSDPRSVASDGTRLLFGNGYFVSSAGVISAGGGVTASALTWDGLNFVAVYVSGSDVYAKRITSAGVVLDPSGVNVTAAGTGTASAPRIASDGLGSFVTWTDTRSGSGDVYGARLSQALAVVDANGINLSTNASSETNGALVWDGTAYLAVWSRGSSSADLVAGWVQPNGTVLDTNGLVIASNTETNSDPALATRGGGQSLVAYQRPLGTADLVSRVYVRTLDAGLVLGGTCSVNSQCASRVCTDGVCCTTASCGTCQACSPATGVCENVAGQDDPDTCTGVNTCNVASQCRVKNGQSCGSGTACASGFCVDGVCCDQVCTGTCQACTAAKKGSGANGVCGPVISGSDPDNECAASASSTCGLTGSCSGSGSCAYWSSGTACGATTCTAGVQTGQSCNGTGSCQTGASSQCTPYACANATQCATTCASDVECASTHYCDTGTSTCKPLEALGFGCNRARQCASGSCTDGVCCDGVCNGLCQACTAAKKGGGTDGACGSIAASSDPDNECATQSATTCGTTGQCNGGGACALYANGTTCGATTCATGIQTGNACNGTGSCLPSSSTPCFPYVCANGTACATTCTANSQCDAAYYCRTSDGTCQPKLAQAAACTGAGQCQSGNCVDGVCCDTACAGTCVACSAAKKLSGADGVCGPVLTATDPDNECSTESQATCGRNGSCSGSGSCAFWSLGTSCATSCSGAVITDSVCNGSGQCNAGSTTACAPYQCATGTTCRTTCSSDGDCVAGGWCRTSDGTCQADQGLGATCTASSQCNSGNCVDGVCCDTACNGNCQACTAVEKGAGTDGTCGNAADGRDPHNQCLDQGAASCGNDGACDGAGLCRKYGAGTSCGATSCVGNSVKGRICTGLGACVDDPSGVDCAPYLCQASACSNPCGSEQDCTVGNYCDLGTCKPKKASGTSCVVDVECQSASCADGVCCDTACAGACTACTAALKGSGADGVCGAVAQGTDPDADCAASSPTSCGLEGSCNGAGACASWPAGTACATSCVGGTLTGSTCNGSGQCLAGSTTPCAPYLCATATSCGSTCAADAQCQSNSWCRTSDGTCQPDLADGSACSTASQCTAGFCVDGVCCNSACNGACQACSAAAKGTGVDGVCDNAADGKDPHNDCPQDSAASCGRDGQCNGAGICRQYASGTACGATSCVGGSVRGQICNGLGQCTSDPVGTACTPYVCSGTACANPCAGNIDCISGYYCDAGTCRTLLVNGEACGVGGSCQSGNCVDGVCCDSACIAPCSACSAAKKGSGADGACGAIVDGTDPDNECAATNPNACGTDGMCDGAAACRQYVRGTACGPSQCNGNRAVGSLCDGFGGCSVDPLGVDCAPYACTAGTCPSDCTLDSQCAADYYCDASQRCVAKGLPGAACTASNACESGFCADGVCCDTACTGQCEACDVTGSEGTCSAVTGAPHGTRTACVATDVTCGGECNGTQRAACTYPAAGTACGTPTCSAGVAQGSACDGTGTCAAQADVVCSPFVCSATACKTTCAQDPDCAAGFHCDTATGDCVPSTGKCVDGNTAVEDSAGNVTKCAPYFCSGGECRDSCDVSTDCATGYVCTEQHCSRRQAASESADDGGCGCRAVGERPSRGGWLALLVVGGLTLARRRGARQSAR